jgi:hypothetical protein
LLEKFIGSDDQLCSDVGIDVVRLPATAPDADQNAVNNPMNCCSGKNWRGNGALATTI